MAGPIDTSTTPGNFTNARRGQHFAEVTATGITGAPVATAKRDQRDAPGSDSFWKHKPPWCQPWTILLTGSLVIGFDGLAYQRLGAPLWLVVPVLLGILAWWFLFLVLVPTAAKAEALRASTPENR